MSALTLYSAALCPFAHRVRLTLAEKGLTATEIEIDPRNTPAGFSAVSPLGKVPVLLHDGARIWESSVIDEYLEEVFPSPPLMPCEPALRAHARVCISFADAHLYATTGAMLHSADRAVHRAAGIRLAEHLLFLETQVFATMPRGGPYIVGEQLTLADIALYPWFEQMAVLERYFSFRRPAACRRMESWRNAVAQRRAVQHCAKPETYYLERYGALLDAAAPASSTVAAVARDDAHRAGPARLHRPLGGAGAAAAGASDAISRRVRGARGVALGDHSSGQRNGGAQARCGGGADGA
jgi:glutathione S-transferase